MDKMIIVGEYPCKEDYESNTFFSEGRDALVRKIMESGIGADMDRIEFHYLHYLDMDEEPLSPNTEAEHLDAVMSLIERDDVKSVVLLGSSLAKDIGEQNSINSCRGKVLTISGKSTICSFSVGHAQRGAGRVELLAKDLHKAYGIALGEEVNKSPSQIVRVESFPLLAELLDHLGETKDSAFDFETTGVDVFAPDFKATCLSISFQPGSSWVIPLDHFESPFSEEERARVIELLDECYFSDETIRKTAHNASFDVQVARRIGIRHVRGRLDDTMLMHHQLDETDRHGLKHLVSKYLPQFSGYEDGVSEWKWNEIPWIPLSVYSGIDTDMTLRLRIHFESELLKDSRVYRAYRNEKMFVLPAICDMEYNGMLVDREMGERNSEELKRFSGEIEDQMRKIPTVVGYQRHVIRLKTQKEMEAVEEKLATCKPKKDGNPTIREEKLRLKLRQLKAGSFEFDPMNFGSSVAMAGLIYDKEGFGYPEPYDTASRQNKRMTGKDYLREMDDHSGFLELILRWRTINKMRSTYIEGVLSRLDMKNYVHTSLLQHGTKSQRLASRDPNLQNIPDPNRRKDEETKKAVAMIKGMFVVPEGHTMVQIDYSQAELRIMAELSGDETMIQAYIDGVDLHALTASKMLEISIEEFYRLPKDEQKKWRYYAKAVNFGFVFGMEAEGFREYAKNSYGLILSIGECRAFRHAYFELYPKVLDYHEIYIEKARKFGYVRTLLGSKRHTPDIHNSVDYIRGMDERVAINSPVQGSSGQITLLSIAFMKHRLDPRVKLVNTVHDSVFLYIPDEILDSQLRIAKETCENLPIEKFFGRGLKRVTMAVDAEISKESWGALEEYCIAS